MLETLFKVKFDCKYHLYRFTNKKFEEIHFQQITGTLFMKSKVVP
jgi:hypothetical protein